MLGAQFLSRAAICHPCPSAHPPPGPLISHRHSIGGTLSTRSSLFLICHLALLQLASLLSFRHFFQRRTASPCTHSSEALTHTHTHLHPSLSPTPPPFEDEGASRCLIYNQGGNAPSPPPPPLPSRCEH